VITNFEFSMLNTFMCKDFLSAESYSKPLCKNVAMKENIVKEKSFQFSLSIIDLYSRLVTEKEFIISKQLLRSGTSIGANIEESTSGESKKDFIHKMSIASKEARETKYWLRLLHASELTSIDVKDELAEVENLVRLLTSIVKTATKNIKN